MVNYTISHTEIILVILGYLNEHGLSASMLELEKESKIKLIKYSKEVNFFRDLILNGNFVEAENFLEPLREQKDFNTDNIIFEIKKQHFLEKSDELNVCTDDLVDGLREIEGYCTTNEYNSLCFTLACNKFTDLAEYKEWTRARGRLNGFNKAIPYLNILYGSKHQRNLGPNNRLLDIIQHSTNYQMYISNDATDKTMPRTITLLKDIIEPKTLKKFNDRNLKNLTITFSKKSSFSTQHELMEDSLIKDYVTPRDGKENNLPYDYEEEYVAQTIDLDQRDFYSTSKNKNLRNRVNKADTIRGVSYKNDGKIDVGASMDAFSKNMQDVQKTPISKFAKRRNSGASASSVMKLQSYRSIQHEPSQDKSDLKSQYSLLKKARERSSSPKPEIESCKYDKKEMKADIKEVSETTITQKIYEFNEKSQINTKSVIDYEESNYNIMTMKEKGYVLDKLPVRAGGFNAGGNYFAIGTNSKGLKICSLDDIFESLKPEKETGDLISTRDNQEIPVIFDQLNHHEGSIYCIDWSQNERLIATGSNDKQVKLLVNPLMQDTDASNILELSLIAHQAKVRTVCFHPFQENGLLSGGNGENEIMIWDAETGEQSSMLSGHEGGTFCIKPSHDGTLFSSVGKDRTLKLWDLRNRDPLFSIDLSDFGDPNSVDINPEFLDINVNNAAVSHEGGAISYWDLNSQKFIKSSKPHTKGVKDLSFSSDGKYLCSASFDNKVQVLNTELEVVKTLEHRDKVLSVTWHPFLPFLLTTSADRTAKIWIPSSIEE